MARVELYGSRETTFDKEGIVGRRRFLSLWPERYAVKPSIGDPFPDLSGLYCTKVRIRGTGQSVAGGGHTHAFIDADYTTSKEAKQQKTGDIVDESLEFSGEMLTREGGRWKDCLQDASKEVLGGQYFPRMVYTITKTYALITEIAKQLKDAIYSVNEGVFLGVEPEKWLLDGATAQSFVTELGQRKWRVTMKFTFNRVGWNKAWHGRCTVDGDNNEKGRWEEVLYIPEGGNAFTEKMYPSYNFDVLVPERRRG